MFVILSRIMALAFKDVMHIFFKIQLKDTFLYEHFFLSY
jgi:hypothetical protein